MESFAPVSALIGGAVIGLAATLLLLLNGRIAGVSGILQGLLPPAKGDADWRLAFLNGLPVGAFLYFQVSGDAAFTRALHKSALSGGYLKRIEVMQQLAFDGCVVVHGQHKFPSRAK